MRARAALAAVLASAGAASFASPAPAADAPANEAESRAVLMAACLEDGASQETCDCFDGFIAENFSARDVAGAALVFSDPVLADDPEAAIAALLSEGYTLPEIMGVVNKVMSLEAAAQDECEAPASPADE